MINTITLTDLINVADDYRANFVPWLFILNGIEELNVMFGLEKDVLIIHGLFEETI